MKKIKQQMLLISVIYVVWVVAFSVMSTSVFHIQSRATVKGVLIAVQVVFIVVIWKLWRKLIAEMKRENEERNRPN